MGRLIDFVNNRLMVFQERKSAMIIIFLLFTMLCVGAVCMITTFGFNLRNKCLLAEKNNQTLSVRVEQSEKRLAILKEKTPQLHSQPLWRWYRTIIVFLKNENLQLQSWDPGQCQCGPEGCFSLVTVNAQGNFFSAKKFLKKMSQLNNLVFKEVDISKFKKELHIKCQLNLFLGENCL